MRTDTQIDELVKIYCSPNDEGETEVFLPGKECRLKSSSHAAKPISHPYLPDLLNAIYPNLYQSLYRAACNALCFADVSNRNLAQLK
jgi:hypothetical protein